jgi:hypothetical protein
MSRSTEAGRNASAEMDHLEHQDREDRAVLRRSCTTQDYWRYVAEQQLISQPILPYLQWRDRAAE